MIRLLVVCGALALSVATAAAEPTTTILNSGPSSNRVDIVVLGDGYTAAELSQYAADVNTFAGGMFSEAPFSSYLPYFNVRRVDVVSAESGADHPGRDVLKDTALHATYECAGIPHLICVDTTIVDDVLLRSVAPDQRDIVIVLVNDVEYGGSGGAVAVASLHRDALELVLHEVGHSFGLLADEYWDTGQPCDASVEPPEPNVTLATTRDAIKWGVWIDAATPVPTPTFDITEPGLYEGGKYCATGIYRPTYDSKMRTLGLPYLQVNTEQLVKRIYNLVSPIDEATPVKPTVTAGPDQRVQFRIQRLRPVSHTLRIRWEIDGTPAGTAATLTVATSNLALGDHVVRAVVFDPTPLVLNDSDQLLMDVRTWTLQVVALSPPIVEVVSPNGGEALTEGTPFTIRWTASDPDGLGRFNLAVSSDDGPFSPIAGCVGLASSRRTCIWRSPGPIGSSLRVRVTVSDLLGATGSDLSDAPFSIAVAPPPDPWRADDVGPVGLAGTTSWLADAVKIEAAGAALWGNADAFHYVHQQWAGNGDVIARIDSLTHPGDAEAALAGVMFRQSLSPDSPHATMLVSTVGKAKFRRRSTPGGITRSDGPATGSTTIPRWVKLSRRGNTFTAYLSGDGVSWEQVHVPATIAMSGSIEVGIFASRNGGASLTTARFASVQVIGGPMLPTGWTADDVGATGAAGSARFGNNEFHVAAAGESVWSGADAFHFVHREWTGDGDLVTRVAGLIAPASSNFALAGIMMRESLTASSRHAAMIVATGGKAKFRRRLATGGITRSDGPSSGIAVPSWLKLTRRGDVFTAYVSSDGSNWRQVHVPQRVVLPETVYVGVVALRNGGHGLASARFANTTISEPPAPGDQPPQD